MRKLLQRFGFLFALVLASNCLAQGTAFTYQGRLNDGVGPANGTYDLRFAIYDAASGGVLQGNILTNTTTVVSKGLFTVTLDFGNLFSGADRWLEIGVRTSSSASAEFTTLSPRQALTSTPYAIQAANAVSANSVAAANIIGTLPSSSISGAYAGAVTFNNVANSFTGSGSGLTGVDAVKFGGLAPENYWRLNGNNVGLGQVLGSTNNQAVEIVVNGRRAMRLEPTTNGPPNVIGGSSNNSVAAGVYGATIGGGYDNSVQLSASGSTIGGGSFNRMETNAAFSTIGGGSFHIIYSGAGNSTIGGGSDHRIETNAALSTISGGKFNRSIGSLATIPGGDYNIASTNAFAAGHRAQAKHQGSFVWADATEADFASTGTNQFLIRAVGGVGINTNSLSGAALNVAGNVVAKTVQAIDFIGNGSSISNVDAVKFGGLAPENYWRLNGNNVGFGQVLGSTNNQAVEIVVNGRRAMRLEPTTEGSPNVIGGSSQNVVTDGVFGATISGGYHNSVQRAAFGSVIGGGSYNSISTNAVFSTIGGGTFHLIHPGAENSTIGGGSDHLIETNAIFSTISGGSFNRSIGRFATIPGGDQNIASTNAFAAGHRAQAKHQGSFVWADATEADFASTGTNQFLIRAVGGVGINTTNLDGAVLNVAGPIRATTLTATNFYGEAFIGNGASLTNLTAVAVAEGTLDDARLSANVPLRSGGNAFTGNQTITKGSVGIGTSNPLSMLDVVGDGRTLFTRAATAGQAAFMEFDNADQDFRGIIGADGDGFSGLPNQFGIGTWTAHPIKFFTSAIERMSITTGGNVGIGTAEPSNKLHVNGGITCTALTQTSDRNAKENFQTVSPADVLEKVSALPISTWNFKESKGTRHLGPMAQDFYAAFGLGLGETTITSVDADGVALAAIQGLNQLVKKKDAEIQELRQQMSDLKEWVGKLAAEHSRMESK